MLSPPSTVSVWPVMKALSSLARNTTAAAISWGVAWRASGIISSNTVADSTSLAPIASTSMACWKALSVGPG